ncbi:MAG: hypothetical protein ACPIOQ_14060, partial [Promethearchaeia archaeon]
LLLYFTCNLSKPPAKAVKGNCSSITVDRALPNSMAGGSQRRRAPALLALSALQVRHVASMRAP